LIDQSPDDVLCCDRDGTERSVEFSMVLLRDAANCVAGVASTMRDVSERFQREKALRAELVALREGKVVA
jgi:hypothetical protein